MRRFAAFAVVVLGLATVTPAAAQNLLVNGAFDTSVPSNATGGGWTSTTIDFAGGWRSGGGNPGAYFVLNDNGGVPDPTIRQTVSGLTPGATYRIEGDLKWEHFCCGSAAAVSFGVLLDGVAIHQRTRPPAGVWQHFSVTFVATAPSHTLAFAGERSGDDSSYGVDNLTMTRLVTEPPSFRTTLACPATARRGDTVAATARFRNTTSEARTVTRAAVALHPGGLAALGPFRASSTDLPLTIAPVNGDRALPIGFVMPRDARPGTIVSVAVTMLGHVGDGGSRRVLAAERCSVEILR